MNLKMKQTFSQPTIKSVFKGENSPVGFSVIKILVNRFINSFGFSTKMDSEQIDSLTVDTLELFGHESLVDVILFFKMARTGYFGTTNRGVDSNLIFGDWYLKYLEKKALLREENYLAKKNERKSIPISTEDVLISYRKKMIQELEKNKFDFIDKHTKNMDRQVLEDTIDSWSKHSEMKKYVTLLKLKRRTIKN